LEKGTLVRYTGYTGWQPRAISYLPFIAYLPRRNNIMTITENPVLARISRPTMLLNEARCRRNLERMAGKALHSRVRFRPHFKTHQSAEIGAWFREFGVGAITVSSVKMAEYFAAQGWDDITIAFPVNWREIEAINRLAGSIHVGLIVEAPETVQFLAERLRHPVDVWIDVDTGYHRTGVAWDAGEEAVALARAIEASPMLRLRGLLTHAGHSYAARSTGDIRQVFDETALRLSSLRSELGSAGFAGLELSVGDTPSCSVVEDLSAVDEIRPGNFVFYDVMQAALGSCSPEDIAVAVACPVVTKNARRLEVVVHGGGVHLSKEFMVDAQGRRSYGAVALPTSEGWSSPIETAYVSSISQEHGVIQVDRDTFDRVALGSLLMVLPVHSCMTADILKSYVTLSGEEVSMMV
jgi:D-serine deaminase-like pyridoxal phosphate-dependent protein